MTRRILPAGPAGRRRRFAALFAMLALVGMVLLASWHDSLPHVHDAGGASHALQFGDHHPGDEPRPDDPMHVAAHVVLQGVAIPTEPYIDTMLFAFAVLWGAGLATLIRSIPPAVILRPPRG